VSEDNRSGGAPAGQGESLDLTKYTMTSPAEIAQHLRSIVASGHMVTVFSNRGRTFLLSRLLAVDHKAGILVFDWGGNTDQNQKLLESERNVFVCSPEGVKTQFVTGQAQATTYEDCPAFVVDMPTEVIKLQRREFFRIQAPLAQPIMCQLLDHPDGPMALPIYDISLGGVGLWLPQVEMSGFDIGHTYRNCVIDLGAMGTLSVVLEVRHRLIVHQRNGQPVLRVGCAYLDLKSSMETLVQRYVAALERERRAMLR
jgi:c-di-GMP-binding flagellar brake protein YcgR